MLSFLFFYPFIVTVCVCHTALKGYLTWLDLWILQRFKTANVVFQPHSLNQSINHSCHYWCIWQTKVNVIGNHVRPWARRVPRAPPFPTTL